MSNEMKLYSFEVPDFCLGAAIGELSKRGALIREAEPINPRPVIEEIYKVEAELDPNQYEEFQNNLVRLIEDGPPTGPFCSFCGKSRSEAEHYFRSPTPDVNICESCVNECVRLMKEGSSA